jgi:hypothetical protein
MEGMGRRVLIAVTASDFQLLLGETADVAQIFSFALALGQALGLILS